MVLGRLNGRLFKVPLFGFVTSPTAIWERFVSCCICCQHRLQGKTKTNFFRLTQIEIVGTARLNQSKHSLLKVSFFWIHQGFNGLLFINAAIQFKASWLNNIPLCDCMKLTKMRCNVPPIISNKLINLNLNTKITRTYEYV